MALEQLYEPFRKWGENNGIWIISDPHFGDEEIKQAYPNRPTDAELVKTINRYVGKNGTLICLGDVGDTRYVAQLKGYKVLIQGNHDSGAYNYKRRDEIVGTYSSIEEAQKDFDNHIIDRIEFINTFTCGVKDNHLFDEVYTGPLMIGEKILLSHEPITTDWAFNIHGHDHNGKTYRPNSLNVCLDAVNYMPASLKSILTSGCLKHVKSIHRTTIDKATERKKSDAQIVDVKTNIYDKATHKYNVDIEILENSITGESSIAWTAHNSPISQQWQEEDNSF